MVVFMEMPLQLHADEYLETPEHALAYVGTIEGATVVERREVPRGQPVSYQQKLNSNQVSSI